MALIPVVLYNAVTVGSAGTPNAPYSATQVSPVANNTLTGNAVAFNFVITTGSTPPGPNARMVFRYGFAMASYTNTAAPLIISPNNFDLRFQNTASTTTDFTTQVVIPILGNYLYCWLDPHGMQAPITLTVNAVPIVITNQSFGVK